MLLKCEYILFIITNGLCAFTEYVTSTVKAYTCILVIIVFSYVDFKRSTGGNIKLIVYN